MIKKLLSSLPVQIFFFFNYYFFINFFLINFLEANSIWVGGDVYKELRVINQTGKIKISKDLAIMADHQKRKFSSCHIISE